MMVIMNTNLNKIVRCWKRCFCKAKCSCRIL